MNVLRKISIFGGSVLIIVLHEGALQYLYLYLYFVPHLHETAARVLCWDKLLVYRPSWTQVRQQWSSWSWVQQWKKCSHFSFIYFGIQLSGKTTYSCWSQLTNVPPHTAKWKLAFQQQPSTALILNGLIKFASSTQLEGRDDDSLLEPLWVFFPIHLSLAHFWRGLPVPLCLNYLAMPSWDAIIQTLIPCNFHTSVCTLTCLMFTITYGGASSPTLRIRDTGAHTVSWRMEGFTHYKPDAPWGSGVHFDIIISYMIKV